jgi:hypothetical protein
MPAELVTKRPKVRYNELCRADQMRIDTLKDELRDDVYYSYNDTLNEVAEYLQEKYPQVQWNPEYDYTIDLYDKIWWPEDLMIILYYNANEEEKRFIDDHRSEIIEAMEKAVRKMSRTRKILHGMTIESDDVVTLYYFHRGQDIGQSYYIYVENYTRADPEDSD